MSKASYKGSLDALAQRVRADLRRCPASGAYEFYRHQTLWDEYCHWIQNAPDGPPFWRTWVETLDPLISEAIDALNATELRQVSRLVVTIAEDQYEGLSDTEIVDRKLIAEAVWPRIDELARDRKLYRFMPKAFR